MEAVKILNSTFDIAMRFLAIMSNCSLQFSEERLRAYSYLSIHISDLDSSKISTHPDLPYRFNNYIGIRMVMHPAIHLLLSKGLLECHNTPTGFRFSVNELGKNCFNLLTGSYKEKLSQAIKEVDSIFDDEDDLYILSKLSPAVDLWGSEFENEYLLNSYDDEE